MQRVAVIGAGTMGQGIAQACAASGASVTVTDVSEAALARGREGVQAALDRLVAKGRLDAGGRDAVLGRITWTPSLAACVGAATVVVEAAPERMALKRELFAQIDAEAPADALLGTNTSSLSITEIASVTRDPSRVVGLHFFNPVPVMELLEVVRGVRTAEGTIERALAFAASLGKTPIVVRDMPGFATSRLGVALGAEAIRMLESGVASAEDIDKAMVLGYGHPMGPLKLTDLVGLDVRLAIADYLKKELNHPGFEAPALMRRMVAEGKLGKKSGQGFYKH